MTAKVVGFLCIQESYIFLYTKKSPGNLPGLDELGDPWGNRTPDTAVKGRCLNRLTNGPYVMWWAHLGSNQGPAGYEPAALPLSYRPRRHKTGFPKKACRFFKLAPRVGLEPTTPRLTAACSTIELSRNVVNVTYYKARNRAQSRAFANLFARFFQKAQLTFHSRKSLSFLLRLGCLNFRSAFASIWRIRSRVT